MTHGSLRVLLMILSWYIYRHGNFVRPAISLLRFVGSSQCVSDEVPFWHQIPLHVEVLFKRPSKIRTR